MKEELKLVKMTNGEELLAMVQFNTSETVTIRNVIRVVIIPDRAGKPTIGLADYVPYVKEKQFTISRNEVLFVADPIEAIANEYRAAWSQLVLPNRTLAVPAAANE